MPSRVSQLSNRSLKRHLSNNHSTPKAHSLSVPQICQEILKLNEMKQWGAIARSAPLNPNGNQFRENHEPFILDLGNFSEGNFSERLYRLSCLLIFECRSICRGCLEVGSPSSALSSAQFYAAQFFALPTAFCQVMKLAWAALAPLPGSKTRSMLRALISVA